MFTATVPLALAGVAAIYARPRHVASGAKFLFYFIIVYYLLGHVNLALSRYHKNIKLADINQLLTYNFNFYIKTIHWHLFAYTSLHIFDI
jgi:hypothetical protein